ncbi:MAG: hypothetical protein RLZZ280_4, partial [Pseudomonadota bacterium]
MNGLQNLPIKSLAGFVNHHQSLVSC